MSCEDEDKDWGDVLIGQGTSKIASKSLETREEAWKSFFLTFLRKNQLCQHLDLGILASRTVRHKFLFKPQFVVFCYSSISKLIKPVKCLAFYGFMI